MKPEPWHAIADARKLAEKIKKKGGANLVGIQSNLVDHVWGGDKPPRPNEKVRILELEFSGKSFEDKIAVVRKELDKKKSAGLIVCKFLDRHCPFQ